MVGGRQVLLSIAVLSGLGFDSVHGVQAGPADPVVTTTSTLSHQYIDPQLHGPDATLTTESSQIPGRPTELSKTSVDAAGAGAAEASAMAIAAPPFADGVPLPSSSSSSSSSSSIRSQSSVDFSQTPPAVTPVQTTETAAVAGPAAGTTTMTTTTTSAGRGGPPGGGPPGGGPPKVSTVDIVQESTQKVDLGYDDPSLSYTAPMPWTSTLTSTSTSRSSTSTSSPIPTSTLDSALSMISSFSPTPSTRTTFTTESLPRNETWTYIPSGGITYCNPSELTITRTRWSVMHTTTITWYGNPEDYTPPYPAIAVPGPTDLPCVIPTEAPKLTLSICASTGTGTKYRTCAMLTTTETWAFGAQTSTAPAVVFLTTDKNPAVVYTSIETPNYGVSQDAKTRDNHASPTGAGGSPNPVYNSDDGGGSGPTVTTVPHTTTPTPVTVAVQSTAVVINGNTIRDNPSQQTQVVIVGGQTFTIDPTRVVGAGTTIDRPSATAGDGGGVFVPTPTTTSLGTLPVTLSANIAIIAGTSFTLDPSTASTVVVAGQTLTIGPATIAAAGVSSTLALPTRPPSTEVVVAGGDLITAIGRSVLVIHGTTLTYSTSSLLPLNHDETLTLGPGGITAHGGALTLGGPHAASPGDTQYALVGGATLTRIGASVVVVAGSTYTLGSAAGTGSGVVVTATTVVVGGESVTIAPDGVRVGKTLSLAYPFGGGAVATAGSSGKGGESEGNGGGGKGGGEEDAAGGLVRPWLVGVVWGFVVVVGVGVVG
ncbi:hypothetical protein C8A05DRAFT_42839 [Staphylotrichum tortipilum]|uniref:Uncharacterized protein n=1 Tax=Staphylotrichum tortipilum TaxID=2831512 RepID=A0AAN6MQ93_9PEZI|nr:hypothetical protein C8A05DRAFT_42839 [Staphylotrichum longicolle]